MDADLVRFAWTLLLRIKRENDSKGLRTDSPTSRLCAVASAQKRRRCPRIRSTRRSKTSTICSRIACATPLLRGVPHACSVAFSRAS